MICQSREQESTYYLGKGKLFSVIKEQSEWKGDLGENWG